MPLRLALLIACFTLPARATEIPGVGAFGDPQKAASGFDFLEGPAWDGAGLIYFTDIPNNKIHTLDSAGKVGTFTAESRHANGLMFRPNGEMVTCEMDGQLVAWDPATETRQVLADKFNGARFNAPNDLVLDPHGGLYFTDPSYRAPEPRPQKTLGVYYLSAAGQVTRVVEDLPNPNGILLSRDGKALYVLPSSSSTMRAYDVSTPGQLGPERTFCKLRTPTGQDETSGADGATLDTAGNLYITTELGLQVVNPQGEILGVLEVPEHPANVTFGGPERKTLYITARTSVYTITAPVAGHVFGVKE